MSLAQALKGSSAFVTGGASGLGAATTRRLAEAGTHVVIFDLDAAAGQRMAEEIGGTFVQGNVLDEAAVNNALDVAEGHGPLRALVHCAGKGGTVRVVDKEGNPGSLEDYRALVDLNLVGTFNSLRLAAARMVRNEEVSGERGVCILTSSVAAWEGQIGQTPYASAKAGIVGMTIVAARDLATRKVRVCTIAPGIFDTPILARFSDEIRERLGSQIPHPSRLGQPDEFASLALEIVRNPMLNGETIRLDGAIRMSAR